MCAYFHQDGFTPLSVALQQGHNRVVAILMENDTRNKVRLPALHVAAKKDDVRAATLLLNDENNKSKVCQAIFTSSMVLADFVAVSFLTRIVAFERGEDSQSWSQNIEKICFKIGSYGTLLFSRMGIVCLCKL